MSERLLKEVTDEVIAVLKMEQVSEEQRKLDLETLMETKVDQVNYSNLILLA